MTKSGCGVLATAAALLLAACGSGSSSTSTPASPAPQLEVPKLAATAPPAPTYDTPGSARFGRELPRVGDKTHTLVVAKSTFVDPTNGPESESYDSDFEEEVLAVNGPAPTRVKVTFKTNEIFDNITSKPTVLAGKSYWVDAVGARVVDAATQAPVSADETTRVLDIVPDLGTRTTIDQVLPDHPLHWGESRDDLAGAILRILHPRFWTLTKGTASLVQVDKAGFADFRIAIAAVSSNSGMTIDLDGTCRIRAQDSKLAQFVLRGTYMRPNGEKGTLEASRIVVSVLSAQ